MKEFRVDAGLSNQRWVKRVLRKTMDTLQTKAENSQWGQIIGITEEGRKQNEIGLVMIV